MGKFTVLVGLCAAACLSVPSWAQQSDASYCAALAQKYQTYTSDNASQRKGEQRDAKVDVAITQCSSKPGDAIPVLEEALKNRKVDLPKRS